MKLTVCLVVALLAVVSMAKVHHKRHPHHSRVWSNKERSLKVRGIPGNVAKFFAQTAKKYDFPKTTCKPQDVAKIAYEVHAAVSTGDFSEQEADVDAYISQFREDEGVKCSVEEIYQIGEVLYMNYESIVADAESAGISDADWEATHAHVFGARTLKGVARRDVPNNVRKFIKDVKKDYFKDTKCKVEELAKIAFAVHHVIEHYDASDDYNEDEIDGHVDAFRADHEITCSLEDVKQVGEILFNNFEAIGARAEADGLTDADWEATAAEVFGSKRGIADAPRNRRNLDEHPKIKAFVQKLAKKYAKDTECGLEDVAKIAHAVHWVHQQPAPAQMPTEAEIEGHIQTFKDDEGVQCPVEDIWIVAEQLSDDYEKIAKQWRAQGLPEEKRRSYLDAPKSRRNGDFGGNFEKLENDIKKFIKGVQKDYFKETKCNLEVVGEIAGGIHWVKENYPGESWKEAVLDPETHIQEYANEPHVNCEADDIRAVGEAIWKNYDAIAQAWVDAGLPTEKKRRALIL